MIGAFVQVNAHTRYGDEKPIGYVVTESGCWEWVGNRNPKGYGQCTVVGRKTKRAHRYVYEMHRGPIPYGMQLDHLCRNRLCVRPDHLEPVTNQENARRAEKVTRQVCLRGHVGQYATQMRRGNPSRVCRACRREDWPKRAAARRARAALLAALTTTGEG